MNGILIKIKEGHKMDGDGEFLGKDSTGEPHTFWRQSGHMEVPLDLAIKLELERPQRFEAVDRDSLKSMIKLISVKLPRKQPDPKPPVEEPETAPEEEPDLPGKDALKEEEEELKNITENKPTTIVPEEKYEITVKTLKDMTKDELNDWAAKRDYELNPSKQNKGPMIALLVKQIEERTGNKVKKG